MFGVQGCSYHDCLLEFLQLVFSHLRVPIIELGHLLGLGLICNLYRDPLVISRAVRALNWVVRILT